MKEIAILIFGTISSYIITRYTLQYGCILSKKAIHFSDEEKEKKEIKEWAHDVALFTAGLTFSNISKHL